MAKVETEEKRIARRMRDQKELAKWKKEQARPKRKAYLLYLMVVANEANSYWFCSSFCFFHSSQVALPSSVAKMLRIDAAIVAGCQ